MRPVSQDEKYAHLALHLARKGKAGTKTNPLVGCVIVRDGKIVGKGFHRVFGGPHAEALALEKAGKKAKGAILYVNLEPCVAFAGKKTPPCTSKLIDYGISKAVISMPDPNPQVRGKGVFALRKNGIEVKLGVLEKESQALNAPYIKFITTHKPYVFLKVAMSLDWKIAIPGKKYFSCRESLKYAHQLRAESDAILVGIGTVLKDDPSLTTRLVKGKDPLRVILDDQLQIPLNARVLKDKNVLLVAGEKTRNEHKLSLLEKRGYSVLLLKQRANHLDLNRLLLELGRRNICMLMVEGGSQIITSFFNERLFDKCHFVYVPEIFGKKGTPLLSNALKTEPRLKILSVSGLGRGLLVEAEPVYSRTRAN